MPSRNPSCLRRSSCDTIRFTILSANCSNKTADVQIDARPCGCSKVPGEVTSGSYEQLTVHDPQGCFLDEPDADLVDREGWAKYMGDDYDGICRWEIFSLCCDSDTCLT